MWLMSYPYPLVACVFSLTLIIVKQGYFNSFTHMADQAQRGSPILHRILAFYTAWAPNLSPILYFSFRVCSRDRILDPPNTYNGLGQGSSPDCAWTRGTKAPKKRSTCCHLTSCFRFLASCAALYS